MVKIIYSQDNFQYIIFNYINYNSKLIIDLLKHQISISKPSLNKTIRKKNK